MFICPKCGSQVQDNVKFCSSCGEKLVETSEEKTAYIEDVTIRDIFLKTTGRLNRLSYFKRSLVRFLTLLVSFFIIYLIFEDYYGNLSPAGNVVSTIVIILFIVPSYCLDVRRLQDMNEKKYYAVANAIIAFLIAIFTPDDLDKVSEPLKYSVMALSSLSLCITMRLMYKDGTHGTNNYGADPLNR